MVRTSVFSAINGFVCLFYGSHRGAKKEKKANQDVCHKRTRGDLSQWQQRVEEGEEVRGY